jgi:hypothetical protein
MTWIAPGFSILGGWLLFFSPEWWGLYLIRSIGFPSHLWLEGTDHIWNFWAVIGDVWYRDILPQQ